MQRNSNGRRAVTMQYLCNSHIYESQVLSSLNHYQRLMKLGFKIYLWDAVAMKTSIDLRWIKPR